MVGHDKNMDKLVVPEDQSVLHAGSNPASSTILEEFARKLAAAQQPLDAAFVQVIEKHFWELL